MATVTWACPQCPRTYPEEGVCEDHFLDLILQRAETPPVSRLVLRLPWGRHAELPDTGELVVGREAGVFADRPADQALDQVSRRHARFVRDDEGELWVEDLASANGTAVDGDDVPPHQRKVVRAGATVRFAQDVDCPVIAVNQFGEPEPAGGDPPG